MMEKIGGDKYEWVTRYREWDDLNGCWRNWYYPTGGPDRIRMKNYARAIYNKRVKWLDQRGFTQSGDDMWEKLDTRGREFTRQRCQLQMVKVGVYVEEDDGNQS